MPAGQRGPLSTRGTAVRRWRGSPFVKSFPFQGQLIPRKVPHSPLQSPKKHAIMKAIPHKERLTTLHAICLQISLQSLFRIFSHASCVHIFRDISGKYSKIHKGFSPFFPSSLKKSDDAICIRQIRNRLSYFTKMLVNTSSIHSAFCFI